MSAAEKVHFIDQKNAEQKDAPQPLPAETVDKTSRDMGKVALFVAILAVVLLVVFFFGLNQNFKGLSSRVDSLVVLKNDVGALAGRMNVVEEHLVALEGLPLKAKKMIMGTMLQEMAQRTAYLSTQMDSDDQNEKLSKAMELLRQVQVEVFKEAEIVPVTPAAPAVVPPEAVSPEAVSPEAVSPEAVSPEVESPEVESPTAVVPTVEPGQAQ